MPELHPLGYWPDTFDKRDQLFSTTKAGTSLPDEFSLDYLYKAVGPLFQYKAGTCVLQVVAQAARMVWEDRYAMGKATPILSRRAGYYVSRSLSGDQHRDDGCYPRFAFQALDEMGFTTEDEVPYDETVINDPIPVSAYQAMADQEHVMRYRRLSSGMAALAEFKEAIALQRRPVGFAVDVVTSFDEYENGVWRARSNERNRGGHYLLAIGYNDRLGAIRFANSWPGFGIQDEGCSFGWMSYEMLIEKLVTDSYVMYPSSLPSHLNKNVIL